MLKIVEYRKKYFFLTVKRFKVVNHNKNLHYWEVLHDNINSYNDAEKKLKYEELKEKFKGYPKFKIKKNGNGFFYIYQKNIFNYESMDSLVCYYNRFEYILTKFESLESAESALQHYLNDRCLETVKEMYV